jgi:hypothetical protein
VVGQGLGQTRGSVRAWAVTATVACFWMVGFLSAAPQHNPAKHNQVPTLARPDIVFVQTPEFVPGPLARRFPKGSLIVRLSGTATKSGPVPLTDGFYAAADPQVSFAGTKVLFSGQKKEGERWQMWEMDLNGSNQRRVTQCSEDCLRGAYLPAEEIALTVEDSQGQKKESYLAVVKADGSQMRRITFGPAEFQLETVLRDGRIVASAPWPLTGGKENGGSELFYTLRPDGTALESFRCQHQENSAQVDAEELEDGSLVFVKEGRGSARFGGALERIQRGAAGATPLGTTQAVYRSPRQLSVDELIVSKAETATNRKPGNFGLYAFHVKTGMLGERIFSDPRYSNIQAAVAAPHAIPKRYWPTLNLESLDGYFISLNSYLAADVARGQISTLIARVRVLTVNSVDGKERSLGEAPVEPDGSFYVRVPANAPIRFVLLDAKGEAIREERSWVWTRPGEQRGCPGCHGDKAIAPENRWPLTLKRFDTPTAMGEKDHGSATTQAK